jgi:hypothetical protein
MQQTLRSFIAAGAAGLPAIAQLAHAQNPAQPQALTAAQDAFLEGISHRSFQFFWEQSDPHAGVTRDKTGLDGGLVEGSARDVGSTGATGFGLTAPCIGAERGWISRDKARERVLNTSMAGFSLHQCNYR